MTPLMAQPVHVNVGASECATDTGLPRPTLFLPRRDYIQLHLVRHLDDGPAKENSGIVKSRAHTDLYWLLNDSGDEPRIYPVHASGESYLPAPEDAAGDHSKLGGILDRAQNVDWEDIAVDDQGHVIVADLGNGHNDRKDLCLYFVDEPAPTASRAVVRNKVVVQYPVQTSFPADEDHFNFDCEAIFTVDNVVYVLTKHRSDNLTRHRHHTAVLVNHSYLYHDDTRFDWPKIGKAQEGNPLSYGMAAAGDNHDGEMLWRKLICESAPFQMVLCGHVTGTPEERMALGDRSEVGYRLSVGRGGNRVHQILFNAQRRGDAGDGWLRLFEFDPHQRTVVVKTYSPWLDQRGLVPWRTDGDDHFTFKLTHW